MAKKGRDTFLEYFLNFKLNLFNPGLYFTTAAETFLFLFHLVFTVDIEKQSSEDDEYANNCDGSHGVLEHDAGEDDRHHLPHRHDDHEGHCSKFIDGKIDKILTNC